MRAPCAAMPGVERKSWSAVRCRSSSVSSDVRARRRTASRPPIHAPPLSLGPESFPRLASATAAYPFGGRHRAWRRHPLSRVSWAARSCRLRDSGAVAPSAAAAAGQPRHALPRGPSGGCPPKTALELWQVNRSLSPSRRIRSSRGVVARAARRSAGSRPAPRNWRAVDRGADRRIGHRIERGLGDRRACARG